MSSFIWSIFAYAGYLAYVVSFFSPPKRWWGIAVPALLIVAWPFTWIMRGMFADPSLVTGLLLWAGAYRQLTKSGSAPRLMSTRSASLIVLVCLALYASALSPMPLDLYYIPGYQHRALVIGVTAACAWSTKPTCTLTRIFPLAALLSLTGMHESRNAWDWFFDPGLLIIAVASLIRFKWSSRSIARESSASMPAPSI